VAIYIIIYDLREATSEDYQAVYDAIRDIDDDPHEHIEESVYLVASDLSAVEIRDALKPHLTAGSKLFVGAFGGEGAWSGDRRLKNWLKTARS